MELDTLSAQLIDISGIETAILEYTIAGTTDTVRHGKIAKYVSKAIIEELLPLKKHVLSITTDNGTEFADHKTVASKLNTIIYFAHPYSSWKKG